MSSPTYSLGSRLESKTSGIIYTKTAPNQWDPSPAGLALGWQPLRGSDDEIAATRAFKPCVVLGVLRSKNPLHPGVVGRLMCPQTPAYLG